MSFSCLLWLSISIHAPPRGATTTTSSRHKRRRHFNSRPSARGDVRRAGHGDLPLYFNSRPSARGDCSAWPRACAQGNFNSRPSARGDRVVGQHRDGLRISIHAPPRGATAHAAQALARQTFQFTPLREGRRACRFLVFCGFPFQFTPLREGRPQPGADDLVGFVHFNSRPSARGDMAESACCTRFTRFQFTPLREGRPFTMASVSYLPSISIHAPPRGATMVPSLNAPMDTYFNSRPSARGDRHRVLHQARVAISIHAPPRGATVSSFISSQLS